jgi:CHAT domain-containing protein/tetratricopeptide (TPR) repeat protein
MGPSPKFLLVIFFAAVLHVCAFSQEQESAHLVFNSAISEIPRNPKKAFQLLTKAMELAREAKDWETYIKTVNKLGSLAIESDEHRDKVFPWLKDAFMVLKDFRRGDDLAELHFNIAEFYNRLTIEIDTPIFHYKEALNIWMGLKGEWSPEVSQCYHGLGNIYKYYKFDFYEAEKCYERALLIREKIGFKDSLKLYRNYYSLAATNRSQFDFEKALSYGSKTLEVAKTLEPRRIELAHGMIANIYRDMHQFELAKEHYLKALSLNEGTDNLEAKAWYYSSLGESFRDDSLYNDAIRYFNMAYALYKTPDVVDQDLFINLIINMMDAYSWNNDYKNFNKLRKEIFNELSSLSKLKSKEASQVWQYIGDHHSRMKNYDSAIISYQKGLNAAINGFDGERTSTNPSEEEIGFNYFVHELLIAKASALQNKFLINGDPGLLRQTIDCLTLAERLFSIQRNALDLEAAKWAFLEDKYDVYENIISTLHTGEKIFIEDSVRQLAFQYFEQSKARSLADALSQAEFSNQISGQDSLFRLLNELKRQLFSAQDLVNKELHKTQGSQQLPELREKIVQLDRKIQACKVAIEENLPGYFKAKYGYESPALKPVQNVLKRNDQALIEFFWGVKSVYAIGISDEDIIFRKVGMVESIAPLINDLMSHLHNEQAAVGVEDFESYSSNAFELYSLLVEPFAPLLKNKKRLQIIPDGAISQVPFEILLEERPKKSHVNYLSLKYLIRSYAIGYAYSSAMLVQEKHQQRISKPSILAVGFAGGQPLRNPDLDLKDIDGTNLELNALENRFTGGRFLTAEDATEGNFKSFAPNFDIIHLAVHGVGNMRNNFAASLFFANKADTTEDGELHAYELYGLKLNALMAVLSSCESGLGKNYRGEGMMSMASAFAYSGCKNTLMSLWKVNDQASIKLIDNFYGYFLEGEAIDDALRKSKLAYLETADELTADPRIWAPLVAYGSLDRIQKNERSRIYIAAGILLMLAILFLSFKRSKASIR